MSDASRAQMAADLEDAFDQNREVDDALRYVVDGPAGIEIRDHLDKVLRIDWQAIADAMADLGYRKEES